MTVNPNSSVKIIEGIGPARAASMTTIGIYNVFDLLRCTVKLIHNAVKNSTSEDQVIQWQKMASLLQVEEVTPQWAEALVKGEIDSIEELSSKQIEDIQNVMNNAKTSGLITDLPTKDQIFTMKHDATIIQYTGVLTITVRNKNNDPITDATANIGDISIKTDQNGRVRLLRIPLGIFAPLQIEHEDYGSLQINDPPLLADHMVIGVNVFTLPDIGDPEDMSALFLSEYNGDELPHAGNQIHREVTLSASELREGDLLLVRQLYKTTPDLQLVSMLKDYKKNEFITYQYKVPLSMFSSKPKIRDAFIYRNGLFKPFKFTFDRIRRYRVFRKMVTELSDRPSPTNTAEFIEEKNEWINFLKENDGFRGFARLII